MPLSVDSAKILEALKHHITELHAEWKTLQELFGVSQEQSDFLNMSAGGFFDTVYATLIRDILLGVARLTDPLSTAGKDNLVLERLTLLPEVAADASVLSKVKAQLVTVKDHAAPIRDYRNKYLAHLDLAASLGPGSEVLPGIKRENINAALQSAADLFNLVQGTAVVFKWTTIPGGPDVLLKRLKDAQSWRALPFHERGRLSMKRKRQSDA